MNSCPGCDGTMRAAFERGDHLRGDPGFGKYERCDDCAEREARIFDSIEFVDHPPDFKVHLLRSIR